MDRDASIFWLFFGFRGRINRKAFLLGGLAMFVVTMFVLYRVILADEASQGVDFWNSVFSVVVFISLWCQGALAAKRLHDIGQSGLYALLMFIPFLNFVTFIVLCALPGMPTANRFGSGPNLPA